MRPVRIAQTALLLVGLLAGLGPPARAALAISLSGGWSETIKAADLTGGAGTDLRSTYESSAEAISLSISGTTGGSDAWRIDVKRVDASWHSSLALSVRRTSSGSGGSVSGGASYREVTDTNATFFSGAGDVTGIAAQLKLSGVSLKVPPNAYSTTVYYTVVDE